MIAEILESDFEAGREIFAMIGNAEQPAWKKRAGEMTQLAKLWEKHGTVLEAVVFPHLEQAARGELLDALKGWNQRIVELATDLARRTESHDADGRWLTDFEELKSLFDKQLLREQGEMVPLIRDRVPPSEVADMTRMARSLRQSHAA